jgi:hypothetical protein
MKHLFDKQGADKGAEHRASQTELCVRGCAHSTSAFLLFSYFQGHTTNGTTQFINASNCNLKYDPNRLNMPIVFDVPIPGHPAAAEAAAAAAAAAAQGSKPSDETCATS